MQKHVCKIWTFFCFQKGFSPPIVNETLLLLNFLSRFFNLVAFICEFQKLTVNSIFTCRFLWLAKWCKIHKVYIHSHSMLLLMFTNIFIHIQQPNLHSRNIFIHIYLCISYSRLYLLTFTRCLHSHSTSYIHSLFIQHFVRTTVAQYKIWTADYGLRTTDQV